MLLFVYTREPQDDYTESLANSVHFAYLNEAGTAEPLNNNYGILFTEAAVDENDVIHEKGVKDPYIFRTENGRFGIIATRVNKDGTVDVSSDGHVQLWLSDDLKEFDDMGLVHKSDVPPNNQENTITLTPIEMNKVLKRWTSKPKKTKREFPFPLTHGYADPVILPWKGKYYFLSTNDNTNDVGLYVRVSDTIMGLFDPGFREALILDKDEEKGFIQTFWAPEFHIIGDTLYILLAIGGEVWGPQCYMMLLKEDGDIMNPADWETPVKVVRKDGSPLAPDGITLDMTYFCAGGKSCLAWSYRREIFSPLDTGSMIFIAKADDENPTQLKSDPVLLTRPLYGWENIQGTINNEGPYPLITDKYVYLSYSGGAANGYTYAVGMLRIPIGADYLDPKAWKKYNTPVLSYYSSNGVYGPGHNSFFTDYDGTVYMMYHGEENLVKSGERCSAMHRVHFDTDGEPIFDIT